MPLRGNQAVIGAHYGRNEATSGDLLLCLCGRLREQSLAVIGTLRYGEKLLVHHGLTVVDMNTIVGDENARWSTVALRIDVLVEIGERGKERGAGLHHIFARGGGGDDRR